MTNTAQAPYRLGDSIGQYFYIVQGGKWSVDNLLTHNNHPTAKISEKIE